MTFRKADKWTRAGLIRAPGGDAAGGSRPKTEIYIPKLAGMQRRLAKLFANDAVLTGGRLQMIGLAEVRDKLGGKWHRVESAVHALTEEVLKENMGDDDVYLRYGADKYLIIFATKTREAAEVAAASIASAIRERLFGDEQTQPLKNRVMVETTIVRFDPRKIADNDNPFADLDHAADSHRAIQQNLRSGRIEDDVDPLLHRAQPMHMVYMPMWDAQRGALSAYLGVMTDSVVQDENTLTNYRQICRGKSANELAVLDLSIMQHVQDEAQAMMRDGRKFLTICPVHIDTLSIASTYSQYMDACHALPDQMRKYLLINLMGVHDGIDKAALRTVVQALKGVARNVWCMAPMQDFTPRLYKGAGVNAVGFFIPKKADERNLLRWMDDVSVSLKMSGLRAFLLDVPSLSIATSAVCAGFSMIGGEIVHDYVDRPQNASRFKHEDLFAGLLPPEVPDPEA